MADKDKPCIGYLINVTGMIGVLAGLSCSRSGLYCSYFDMGSAAIFAASFPCFGS